MLTLRSNNMPGQPLVAILSGFPGEVVPKLNYGVYIKDRGSLEETIKAYLDDKKKNGFAVILASLNESQDEADRLLRTFGFTRTHGASGTKEPKKIVRIYHMKLQNWKVSR